VSVDIEAIEPIQTITTPIRLEYQIEAGTAMALFLAGLGEGKIRGQRCPVCREVYVPPRGSCPKDGVPTEKEVEVSDEGVIETFCIVNIPFYGQVLQIPYVCGSIRLDGADLAFQWLVEEVKPEDVHRGMRVKAEWVPPEELRPSMESIRYFKPVDAGNTPDA
jgi:uncharacterized OB-fold protein